MMPVAHKENENPSLGRVYVTTPRLSQKLGGITAQTIRDLVARGVLPQPVRLGHRTILWPVDAIDAALDAIRNDSMR